MPVTFSPDHLSVNTWVNKYSHKKCPYINSTKVNMMKTTPNARSIRNTLMAAVAVSAMTLPLLASASASNISVAFDPSELNSAQGQERLYEKMKIASRKLCGSTSIQVTGSLSKSVGNSECYEGTLTAAVQRLNNDAITALHSQ